MNDKRRIINILIIIMIIIVLINIPLIPTTRIVTYSTTEIETKTETLFEGRNLYIQTFGYRYSGPYYLKAGQTITVSWDADSIVNVYIMNEVDWSKRLLDSPTSYRAFKSATSGTLSYTLRYDEPIYIQVMTPTWTSAKLYTWKETLSWQETKTIYLQKTITEYKTLIQLIYEKLTGKN